MDVGFGISWAGVGSEGSTQAVDEADGEAAAEKTKFRGEVQGSSLRAMVQDVVGGSGRTLSGAPDGGLDL